MDLLELFMSARVRPIGSAPFLLSPRRPGAGPLFLLSVKK